MPALDDEFAKDVSEFETLDEYKADLAEKLKERKQNELNSKKKKRKLSRKWQPLPKWKSRKLCWMMKRSKW